MKENDDLHICKNHDTFMTYKGDMCPWCAFQADVVKKLVSEYKRGFEDGVKAADTEYMKKEAEREGNISKQGTTLPPRGRSSAGGGDSEGVEETRSVDERGE
jgi:hypothetical protein